MLHPVSHQNLERSLFEGSRWAGPAAPAAEAHYLQRLAPLAGLYAQLTPRIGGERALCVLREITGSLPLLQNELAQVDLAGLSGVDRLMAFRRHMASLDEDRFNTPHGSASRT